MQDLVNRFTLVHDYARFRLHCDDLKGPHRLKIAKASVRDRANSSRAAAEKSADRRLDDRRWIAPQFPSRLSPFILEFSETYSGLANGYTFPLNFLDAIHAAEVKDNAAT